MNPDLLFTILLFGSLFFAMYIVFLLGRKRWTLLKLIRANNPIQIESARSRFTKRNVPYLVKTYWQTNNWEEKTSIVELLQDQTHPDLARLMLDFATGKRAERMKELLADYGLGETK